MANTKSAAKRARQDSKRTARNTSVLTNIKTEQKRLSTLLTAGKTAEAKAASIDLTSKLDKAAKRGIIHKNAADRRKSRVAKALKAKAA